MHKDNQTQPLTPDMEKFIVRALKKYPHGRIPRQGIMELGGNHRTWEGMEDRGFATVTSNAVFLRKAALDFGRQRMQTALGRRERARRAS